MHYLEQYATATKNDFKEIFDVLSKYEKSKPIEEKITNLLKSNTISIAKIQRILNLGFANAAKIKERFEEENLITKYEPDNASVWLNRDEEKVRKIIKEII